MKNIWNKKLIASLFFAIIASMVLSLNCFAQEDNTVYFIKYNNYEPYQMYENGELKGFEVAIAEEIFANSPYDYEFVSKNELDGLAGLSHFGYGKYDIIDDTNHVKSDILYNKVFAPFTLASQNGEKLTYSSLKKLNVGVTETNYCLEVLKGKGIEPTVYKGDFDGIKALLNGEIDVWFSEVNVVNAVSIAQNVKSMLFYHNELVIEGPVSIILPNKNPEMVKFVNNEIANLKSSGKFETIYENYFLKHSSDYIARNKRNRTINGVVTTSAIFIVVFLLSYKKIYKVFSKSKLSINIAKNMLNYGNRFIIIWKSDFTYCEVNNYFKDSFGLEKEVMNGDLNGYFDRIFSQDQVKLSQEDVEKMLAIDSVVTKTKDVKGVDREIKWISIIMINGKKSKTILSIGSDNTEKKTLERELKVTEERYQIAMESTDIAMIYLDRNGAVPYLSDVGYRLLGMNKSEKLSLDTILERVHQADRKELQDNILACAKNIVVSSSCEARILGSNGRYKWYMFKFKLVNYDVTGEICLAGAFYDIDDDKQKDFQIEKLAFEDDLTGIYNRHKFFNIVKETLIYAKFNNLRYAIIAINLDKFHRFNDLYGVETGDKILKAVANILRYNPYGRYCTCARLGNDEFACLIKLDEPKNDQIENYILEISSKIQDYSSFEYDDMKLTISAGACVYPDNVDDYHEVYERAVFSMRIAKADPNIIFQIYNTSIKEMIIKREILEKELQEAIDKKQFELYYQPKVDIHTEKIVGAEALIRWNHPQRGVVSPIEFIPIAEEMGIIGEIGKWTLETACTQNKLWQNSGFKPIKVSVNISSIEFYQSDIVGIVKKTLAKANLSPEWLEIELTESMALVDMEETVFKMNALRDIGVGLSMDDFGTGYSSLSYIQNLPIDELKLDKSFINKIALDDTTQNIISAIINLAKIIGLVVVAEGVEVREQFNLLKMMDCNLIQGYLFSKPVKITEIVNMMEINLIETKH